MFCATPDMIPIPNSSPHTENHSLVATSSLPRCGAVAIVGMPNAGKSTLLNYLIGKKISITSRKPQTTRKRVLGIRTEESTQYVFIDTPGFQTRKQAPLYRTLRHAVGEGLNHADVVLLVIDGDRCMEDDMLLHRAMPWDTPTVIAINKMDKHPSMDKLMKHVQMLANGITHRAVVPISAHTGHHIPLLLSELTACLPQQDFLYPVDMQSDISEESLISERIREKIFLFCGDELPYATEVVVEQYEQEGKLHRIEALVWVEHDRHKAMLIGKKGTRIKQIGTAARLELENYWGAPVYLQLQVKVQKNWTKDPSALRTLGYV